MEILHNSYAKGLFALVALLGPGRGRFIHFILIVYIANL